MKPSGMLHEMGNQQERLAAYLAGVVDGEGWVGVSAFKRKGYGVSLRPQIAVHVVSWDWAEELYAIANELELPSRLDRQKNASRWSVEGVKRVSRWIPVLRPYLRNKGTQMDLIVDLIQARDGRHWHSSEPTPDEWRIVKEIRALNNKGKNPQRLHAERFLEHQKSMR